MKTIIFDTASQITNTVFTSFLGYPLAEVAREKYNNNKLLNGCIISLGVTGSLVGNVTFLLPEKFAREILTKLTGEDHSRHDEVVYDHLGEIFNIIVGNITTELQKEYGALNITTPVFTSGEDMEFHALKQETTAINMKTDDHEVVVFVSLKEK